MNWPVIESGATAFGALATAVGVGIGAWQIWRTRKQGITAFEDEMSRQYRDILKTIPMNALLGKELSQHEFDEAEDGIYHYLDLSNEQVFLRQNNRVSSETWKSWCDGIKANLSRTAFSQVWIRIKKEVPNNFLELQKLEATKFEGDPCKWKDLTKPKTLS